MAILDAVSSAASTMAEALKTSFNIVRETLDASAVSKATATAKPAMGSSAAMLTALRAPKPTITRTTTEMPAILPEMSVGGPMFMPAGGQAYDQSYNEETWRKLRATHRAATAAAPAPVASNIGSANTSDASLFSNTSTPPVASEMSTDQPTPLKLVPPVQQT